MVNLIVLGMIVAVIGAAIVYIVRAKKKGVHCIGCPSGGCCSGHCSGEDACACHTQSDADTAQDAQ